MAEYQIKIKLKPKDAFWIIPILVLIALIIFLVRATYTKDYCGDGICQESEIEGNISLCDLDCDEMCIGTTGGDIEDECSVGWEGVYLNLIKQGEIPAEYLQETEFIDFSNPIIKELALELRRDTPKETAKAIAEWTYSNIIYNKDHIYYDCLYWKASDIIQRGEGVCSTMSKINIALLRANGIPAYSTTGCFKFETICRLKQTILRRPFPKFINITIDETGYAPTYGYLHNWVMFPLIEDGEIEYIILESTSGQIYEDSCINYREYYVNPTDSLTCGLRELDPNVYDCKNW